MHVDHGQAIAELAQEEGHQAQEEAGGDFGIIRHDDDNSGAMVMKVMEMIMMDLMDLILISGG